MIYLIYMKNKISQVFLDKKKLKKIKKIKDKIERIHVLQNSLISELKLRHINLELILKKLKALKQTPNRSGVQVNRRLLKGNRLVIRYVAQGELVRP